MQRRPVVGLSADLKHIAPHDYHCVGDKYIRTITHAADALPVMLPALTDGVTAGEILGMVDGIVLTGSYANIHPQHYDGGEPHPDSPLDEARDAANLRLIPAALEAGIPVLGVCRGFQEINVALGGTLHQKVHEHPDYEYHLEDASLDLDGQYGPAHPVTLEPGGILARLADTLEQTVNSLHAQGIDRLAHGLSVEARAHDGLIEGFSVAGASAFALAVQWHPEWKPHMNPFYAATWRAFGAACRERAASRRIEGE
ncbi:MAG: gamma-glutamyl-gamma-aminobutyrate hydrolase family protein [Gammaproteobacteria bacterium]|nr:gamma-glutamyl-gamma-aminobutyrate hydrolase family protein [Gammaproteobacteria bacterium]NNF61804.1 gamma-glutamyl-gamma-aminobutyrate hydrolase family protein [Gammaproteobacteria bacterium]NNM19728.1 gamma-glutamyl-gamma-aminobutyrate hydrolase family protein [Gammaproteobacteria bacterium]